MSSDVLHCRVQGAGDSSLILLHGLLGQGVNLESVARGLSQSCRVLLPDLRNHGRSFHSDIMNYRVMAADIVRLMDAHAIQSASLLGHSMGGKVAMQFALDHPARCERLIVADIAPVAYPPHHTRMLAALRAITDSAMDRAATRAVLEQSIAEPAVVSLLLMSRVRGDDGAWFWRFNVDAISRNYQALLAAPDSNTTSDAATLFISGEDSPYMNPANALAARRSFPRASFESITGAGHWLHVQQPAHFLRSVREFCGLDGQAGSALTGKRLA